MFETPDGTRLLTRPMEPQPAQRDAFFAYAGQPALRAEAMREAIEALNSRGISAEGWQSLSVAGRILLRTITERIDECGACVAEISSANPNVLFEAGYAISRGKRVLLTIDETDQEATRVWDGLMLLQQLGRINHGGNGQLLANQVARTLATPAPSLAAELLAGGKPREENAVFCPPPPHMTTPAAQLQRTLERQTHLKLLSNQEEFGHSSLAYYTQSLYRASAARTTRRVYIAPQLPFYNARRQVMAGLAHGFELPLLMVAEPEYKPPIDYGDMLFTYGSTRDLIERVKAWLDALPVRPGSNRRLGNLKLPIELPLRDFGEFVAESEKRDLGDYFVQTTEFDAVVHGRAAVFVGRKGTGKTANMLQATDELRKDKRNLVVPIKPSSYDLSALLTALEHFNDRGRREYFLLNLWFYLLATEIAIRAIRHAENLPAGLGADSETAEMAQTLARLGVDLESDFGSRLEDALDAAPHGADEQAASAEMRKRWKNLILPKLRPLLASHDRVCLLVDNLDKTWERGANYDLLSHFILSLLVTTGKIQDEFKKSKRGEPPVQLTSTIFLRTDIYDVIKGRAREADKINPRMILWADEELLVRVLEDRYTANRKKAPKSAEAMWEELFCPEVHGLPVREYFLWRALRRPRDVIFLANAALSTAINRKHDRISQADFTQAEKTYSQFAVEALLVESEAQGFDLEEVLLSFAGLGA